MGDVRDLFEIVALFGVDSCEEDMENWKDCEGGCVFDCCLLLVNRGMEKDSSLGASI